ncbi:MAG: VTC domain-containing protein [Planctomycetota bacterium]
MTSRNRHECKFLVDEAVAARVLRAVQPFLAPDPHGGSQRDPRYTVRSLYLDDDRRSLGRETIEGFANRYKLRVRSYGDDDRVFLEVKRRLDRVVQKLRCAVPTACLADALAGAPVRPDDDRSEAAAALAEFQRLLLSRRARPVAVVRYEREAYVGRSSDEVRVTIDRRLHALSTDRPELPSDAAGYRPVPLPGVVLELKFTDRMPRWLHAAIVACDLRRVSCSKYCRALDALAGSNGWRH